MIALSFTLAACGLINLEPLIISTTPADANAILPADTPITVSFSLDVRHLETEQAMRISSNGQSAAGDFSWTGNTLIFTPVPPLKAGQRYLLNLSGPIEAVDGRQFPASIALAFYSVSDQALPVLNSFLPENGADAAVDAAVVLQFDRAMDADSVKRNFSVSPATTTVQTWNEDGTQLTISPESQWQSCTCYSWTLSAKAKDSSGLMVGEDQKASFQTQADSVAPKLASWSVVAPSTADDGTLWQVLSTDPADFRNGDALRFDFSEPVDVQGVSAAFGIKPSVKGHLEAWDSQDSCSWIWVPDQDLEPETSWEISWNTAVKDLAGNALQKTWKADFQPELSWATLLSVELNRDDSSQAQLVNTFKQPRISLVFPPRIPENAIRCTLRFDHAIPQSSRAANMAALNCVRWFPDLVEVTSPSLTSVSFPDEKSISLQFEGFSIGSAATASQAAIQHSFRLSVAGGMSGMVLADGYRLKEDQWIVFATN